MNWLEHNDWLTPSKDNRVRWGHLRRFLSNYARFRRHLLVAAALAFAGSSTSFLIPLIFRRLQDAVLSRDVRLLVLALAAFVTITLIELLMTYWIQVLRSRMATRLNSDLILQYYRKILNLPIEDFIAFRQNTNLFQRVVDAMAITDQFTEVLIRGGRALILVLTLCVVIGRVSPIVLGVIAVGIVALFAHVLVSTRRLKALRRRSLAVNYPLVSKMLEILNSLLTIKALSASVHVTTDVVQLAHEKADANYDESIAEARTSQVTALIGHVALVGAIGATFLLVLADRLLVADIFTLYVLTQSLLQPISYLANQFHSLSRVSINLGQYYGIVDLPDEAALSETRRARNGSPPHSTIAVLLSPPGRGGHPSGSVLSQRGQRGGHIELRDVAFAYRDGPEVLSGVNLEILCGEKVSLIGRSGVGKTTLIRLILGFLEPRHGAVLVNGVDVAAVTDRDGYRRQFGVVSQQDVFFGVSLRENLRFGLDGTVTDDEIAEAIQMVDMWRDIQRLSLGLSTPYSPDLFSGGQQQRLFIARALLRRPTIVLFDEPTSALDFESERQVMQALDLLVGDKTMVTIAHRLSTVQSSDRVALLEAGRVAAYGTHDHLYESSDYYRSMCRYNSFSSRANDGPCLN